MNLTNNCFLCIKRKQHILLKSFLNIEKLLKLQKKKHIKRNTKKHEINKKKKTTKF